MRDGSLLRIYKIIHHDKWHIHTRLSRAESIEAWEQGRRQVFGRSQRFELFGVDRANIVIRIRP